MVGTSLKFVENRIKIECSREETTDIPQVIWRTFEYILVGPSLARQLEGRRLMILMKTKVHRKTVWPKEQGTIVYINKPNKFLGSKICLNKSLICVIGK
jgi:hypothetical protein